MLHREPKVSLPNTPERRQPLIECGRCGVESNPHTGVHQSSGKFKCALCYRKALMRMTSGSRGR